MTPLCETYAKSITVLNGPDEKNLDAVYASSEQGIIAVFDGMSSNEKSRWVSQKAVEMMRSRLSHVLLQESDRGRIEESLKILFVLMTRETIREMNYKKIKESVCSTGVLGKYFIDEASGKPTFTCAHIGDSRMYRMRNRNLECLTIDHNTLIDTLIEKPDSTIRKVSLWQDMFDRVTSEEQFMRLLKQLDVEPENPDQLKSWLTAGPKVSQMITNWPLDVSSGYVRHYTVMPDDEYYGVTDGISSNVHPDRLRDITASDKSIEEKGKMLIREAEEHPVGFHAGPDDMSVAILKPLL